MKIFYSNFVEIPTGSTAQKYLKCIPISLLNGKGFTFKEVFGNFSESNTIDKYELTMKITFMIYSLSSCGKW